MKWRRINHLLHRDVGYFCIGLTIIYAISGIAVNHTSHGFNPSYSIEKSTALISALGTGTTPDQQYIDQTLAELNIVEPFKNGAMLTPGSVRIFTESYTIDVNYLTGNATLETVKKLPVLFEFNFLHLNKGKGMWTWIADLYGVALFLLAITGMLMIRGRVRRRGLLLTGLGIILPLAYILLYL